MPPFDESVAASVESLPAVRSSVARWLAPIELSDADLGAVQVVVSELLANAVEATPADQKVSVRLTDQAGSVEVEVVNPSARTAAVPIPPMADPLAPRGRGLAIVRSLSEQLSLSENNGHTVASCRVPITSAT
jgi:anti-sigma regulatory factor (Ser/Thr protein kinase)